MLTERSRTTTLGRRKPLNRFFGKRHTAQENLFRVNYLQSVCPQENTLSLQSPLPLSLPSTSSVWLTQPKAKAAGNLQCWLLVSFVHHQSPESEPGRQDPYGGGCAVGCQLCGRWAGLGRSRKQAGTGQRILPDFLLWQILV